MKSEYEQLLKESYESTVYHTSEYVHLVSDLLDAEAHSIGVTLGGRVVGVLPFALKRSRKHGSVINSLPYFGSYGGPVVHSALRGPVRRAAKITLLRRLGDFARGEGCVLSTVIASPFEEEAGLWGEPDYSDTRIGQVATILFNGGIMGTYSQACRRAVRKAAKSGVRVEEAKSGGWELDEFYRIYVENMAEKKGAVRDKRFFEEAFARLPEDRRSLLYATHRGRLIAGVFMLYYGDKAHYVQPASSHEGRRLCATNLLVYRGMEECARRGIRRWDFGGTWLSQQGVYRFKKSFGASDYPYRYFVTAHGDCGRIERLTPEELGGEYRGFYVIPYGSLKT